MKLTPKEERLRQINTLINVLDEFVKQGDISRAELTDLVLKRHILAIQQVSVYALKNMGKA